MPINLERVLAAAPPDVPARWTPDDVIVYHLGLGAGASPDDPTELGYVLQRCLTVLPTYAVIPAFAWLPAVSDIDGLDIDPGALLHGEHELRIEAPLWTEGAVITSGRVVEVLDKGKDALLVLEAISRNADGAVQFVNRFSCFLRGEGGFGGPRGANPGVAPPERAPDAEVRCPTLPQQALLYRLSGDRNPLHVDPAHAARAGFDRPLLHGLCSFGIAAKAVIDTALAGDGSRVRGYRARFAGVVFPGETLVVRLWDEGDALLLTARSLERGTPVLSNAVITLGSAR